MAKILLVEDDNNLREIYEARLQAEGYTIVSAKDGEEALVKAKQERPELIISDVMMPRISGFEMLDILRNTEGLKNAKVIMLTALGQAEDKTRADKLGADRYLVKSQVTLEDIVKAADELLSDGNSAPAATNAAAATASPTTPTATPAATATPSPAPTVAPIPVQAAPEPAVSTPTAPTSQPSVPVATPPAVAPATPAATPTSAAPAAPAPTAQPQTTAPAEPATAPEPPKPEQNPTAVSTPTPQITEPVAAPAVNTPSVATPPVSAPAPVTPAPEPAAATAPVATTPAPQPKPAASSDGALSTDEEDDKLIADAVKDLTAGLGGEEKAEPAPEATTAPSVPAEPVVSAAPAVTESTPKTPEVPAATTAQAPETTPSATPATEPETAPSPSETPAPSVPAPAAPALSPTPEIQPTESTPTPSAEQTQPPENPAAVTADVDNKLSTTAADEQATMQAQINDYIRQQVLPGDGQPSATATPSTTGPADAPSPAVEEPALAATPATAQPESQAETPAPEPEAPAAQPEPTTIQPSATAPAPVPSAPSEPSANGDDNVTVAGKKIIQPPVEPLKAAPNLQDLLAKEGIGMDEDDEQGSAPVPGGGVVPPHQPGHVISPNGGGFVSPTTPAEPGATASGADRFNPSDPNNISL